MISLRPLLATFSLLAVLPWLVTSCSTPFQAADKNFKGEQYHSAIQNYKEALADGKLKPQEQALANYRIAESLRLSNKLLEAMPYYELAERQGQGTDIWRFHYAFGLKMQGKYDDALVRFKAYTKDGQDFELAQRARAEIKNVEELKRLMVPDEFIYIDNCLASNTDQAEFSPVFMPNGDMAFTAVRRSDLIYEGTGAGYTDMFFFRPSAQDSCQGEIIFMDSLLNTPNLHEASASFSKDGRTVIFARSNSGSRKEDSKEVNLFESTFDGKRWSEPIRLPFSEPKHWDACPAISQNGKTLYFASNRPGGFGGLDLYRATKGADGKWGNIVNMGKSINTPGNEMFPFVSRDNKLYFSSDGHAGLGGLDLFMAVRKDGKINIQNMGAPYNSSADDFAITFRDKTRGAFTSNREGSKGDDDIYVFEDRTPAVKPVRYYLAGVSMMKRDTLEVVLPNAKVSLLAEDGKVVEEVTSDDKGRFRFAPQLNMDVDYRIIAQKQKFLADTVLFTTGDKELDRDSIESRPEKIVEVVLQTKVELLKDIYDELVKNGEITLNNILYDFDDYRIRPDAATELNKLALFMRQYPKMRIELGSHTDDRGNDRYNERLSQLRAEAAVAYLESQGIKRTRLQAKGYGEAQPVVDEAQSEEEHQQNRRTTVALLDETEE